MRRGFTFGSDIPGGSVVLPRLVGWKGAGGALFAVPGCCVACSGRLVLRGGDDGAGGICCQGGAAVAAAGVLRRRLRVLGGRPLPARCWFSSCRVFQAARMRWLRTASSVVTKSIRGVRPVRRHQPRLMSLLAGSLAVANPRSAPVRRR